MDKRSKTPFDSGHLRGGHIPGEEGQPAFELIERKPALIPVLIAVPHAGRAYPADLIAQMRNPEESCLRLEDRFVDLVARQVALESGASLLLAHAPRAMIDLNRAPEDMDWGMVRGGNPVGAAPFAAGRRARSGLGLVPRRLPGMGELWKRRMEAAELARRIDFVHRPYHSALTGALEHMRDRWGTALLLDLHSMPPLGSKVGGDPAPDFVIGDRYGCSCSANLSSAALASLEDNQRPTAHNRPYAGGYVLDRHASPARGVHGLQLEICRSAYLDPALQEKGGGLGSVVEVIAAMVQRLADELISVSFAFPQAAE